MVQRYGYVLIVVLICSHAGCRPNLIKHGKKAVQNLRGTSSKAKSAQSMSDEIAQQLSRNADDVTQIASRATQLLSRSKTLGARLVSLQAKIPAGVYQTLYTRWQQNQAELTSYSRQLQDPDLAPDRRGRLEQNLEMAVSEQAEIERLVEQYG